MSDIEMIGDEYAEIECAERIADGCMIEIDRRQGVIWVWAGTPASLRPSLVATARAMASRPSRTVHLDRGLDGALHQLP